jgi:hypothetical protein
MLLNALMSSCKIVVVTLLNAWVFISPLLEGIIDRCQDMNGKSTLKWDNVGTEAPDGKPLTCDLLSIALKNRTESKQRLEFTNNEWENFDISEVVTSNTFVFADPYYYKPAEGDVRIFVVPFGECVADREKMQATGKRQTAVTQCEKLVKRLKKLKDEEVRGPPLKAAIKEVNEWLHSAEGGKLIKGTEVGGSTFQALNSLHHKLELLVQEDPEEQSEEVSEELEGGSGLNMFARLWNQFLDAGTSQGLVWHRLGAKPSHGKDLKKLMPGGKYMELQEALMKKTTLTVKQWAHLATNTLSGSSTTLHLEHRHYVKDSNGMYYQPAVYPKLMRALPYVGLCTIGTAGFAWGILAIDEHFADAPPSWVERCGLEPHVSCLFFEPECLEAIPGSKKMVSEYMSELTNGLTLWQLLMSFFSNVLLLTLATLGGVPVPHLTMSGTGFFYFYMGVQFLMWLTTSLAFLADLFVFVALRTGVRACLITFEWPPPYFHPNTALGAPIEPTMRIPVLDVSFSATIGVLPIFVSRLLALFICTCPTTRNCPCALATTHAHLQCPLTCALDASFPTSAVSLAGAH